jgi:hypothetical protein
VDIVAPPPTVTEADLSHAQAVGGLVRVYHEDWTGIALGLADVGEGGRRSHSGVEVISGEVRVEENRDLLPSEWRGRRNEPGVIDAMLLDPIGSAIALEYRDNLRSAPPRLEPPADATSEELADLEYIEQAVFRSMPGLGWAGAWSEMVEGVIRGLGLFERTFPLDRGLGAHVCRLDPILAWSIDDWIKDADGWGIRQYSSNSDELRGRGGMSRGPVLESRRLMAVRYGWQNRGGNPEPYGLMRPGYRSWKSRRLLHLLLMNGSERAAYGIPYVEIDPEVAQKGDLETVQNMLRNWRSSLRGMGTFPPGYRPGILTVPFEADKVTALYDRMGIEWFQACGTPHLRIGDGAGAMNLHESMGSAFGRRLQGIGAMLAETVFTEIVRPLVLLRRPGAKRFPRVTAGETLIGSPVELVGAATTAIQSGAIKDRAGEVEDRLRSLLMLPEIPEDDEGEAPEVDEDAEADPDTAEDAPVAYDGGEVDEDSDADEETVGTAEPLTLSDRYGDRVDQFGRILAGPGGRPLRAAEAVISLAETRGRTEEASNAVASAVGAWRMDAGRKYADALAKAGTFDAMRAVPVPMQRDLLDELQRVYRRVYAAGLESVKAERERFERRPDLRQQAIAEGLERGQGGDIPAPETLADCGHDHAHALADKAAAPAPAPGLPSSPVDAVAPEDVIRTTALTTVDAEAAKMRTAALSSLQSAGRGGLPPAEADTVAAVVRGAVEQLSLPLARVQGQRDAGTLFGLAREQEQRAQGSTEFIYSNLLESNTCAPCADLDGDTFGVEQMDQYATPFAGCEGGDLCNCLIIALD